MARRFRQLTAAATKTTTTAAGTFITVLLYRLKKETFVTRDKIKKRLLQKRDFYIAVIKVP